MDGGLLLALALGVAFFLWRRSKASEAAKVASDRLERDTQLYRHIKTGLREYNWREREDEDEKFSRAKNGELLFETAHLSAYHVDHSAEFRVGFYFKDIDEYGLYGVFAGYDDDVIASYYRTDRTFKEEQMLTSELPPFP